MRRQPVSGVQAAIRAARWLIAPLGFVVALSCGGRIHKGEEPQLRAPSGGLVLRAAFDRDPSPYLGRFVPDGADPASVDESAGLPRPCSAHYSIHKSLAGGTFDELVWASARSTASFVGVPVSAVEGRLLRVRYTATEKWVAVPRDPEALDACCRRAPDQCSQSVIGEFVAGVGEIYEETRAGAAGGAEPVISGAGGSLWRRVRRFDSPPVFFAFRVTAAQPPQTDVCATDWENRLPAAVDRKYFVGVSRWVDSELGARRDAAEDARVAAAHYVREVVAAECERHNGGAIDGETIKERGAVDCAQYRKAPETFLTGMVDACHHLERGAQGYKAHVLSFRPD